MDQRVDQEFYTWMDGVMEKGIDGEMIRWRDGGKGGGMSRGIDR
jgi:hypothetical protein